MSFSRYWFVCEVGKIVICIIFLYVIIIEGDGVIIIIVVIGYLNWDVLVYVYDYKWFLNMFVFGLFRNKLNKW